MARGILLVGLGALALALPVPVHAIGKGNVAALQMPFALTATTERPSTACAGQELVRPCAAFNTARASTSTAYPAA
jgi:hypothetical protein